MLFLEDASESEASGDSGACGSSLSFSPTGDSEGGGGSGGSGGGDGSGSDGGGGGPLGRGGGDAADFRENE